MINRPFPLQQLMRFKDKQLVKVVTGIHRSEEYEDRLLSSVIDDS